MIKYLSSFFAALLLCLSFSTSVLAQVTNPAISPEYGSYAAGDPNTPGADNFVNRFGTLFVSFWSVIITVSSITTLALLIWGSIEWISAGGDSSKIEKARARMTQAIVGLVILVSLFTIISIINQVVFDGTFDILNISFPTPL